jgi:hypothetical protein
LPYKSKLRSLPCILPDDGTGLASIKSINKCWIGIKDSGSFYVSVDDVDERVLSLREYEGYGEVVPLKSGEYDVTLMDEWKGWAQISIIQKDALPLEILYLGLEVQYGG